MAETALDDLQIDVTEKEPTDWAAFDDQMKEAPPPAPAPSSVEPDIVLVQPPAPAPAPTSVPAPEVTPAPAPEPTPAPAPAADDTGVLKRVRLDRLSEENQLAISILARNEDMKLEDALSIARQRLGINTPFPSPAPAPGEAPNPEAGTEPTLEDELAEVDRQLEELASEGGTGTIYDPTVNALNRQRSELIAKLQFEKLSTQQVELSTQQQAAADYDAAAAAAEEAAMAAFGDHLSNPTDPLAQAVTEKIATLAAIHEMVLKGDTSPLDDPDTAIAYAEFRHPEFAKRLTFSEAARLNIQPKAAGGTAAAPTPPPPVGHSQNPQPGTSQATPRIAPISGGQGTARVEIAAADPADAWKTGLADVPEGDFAALDQALSQTAGGFAAVRIL